MATYTGDVHFYFNGNLNAANFDNETIADNLLDAEFTAGEIVNDGTGNLFGDGLGTYVGSIDIGGTLYPIFSDENAGTLADPALFLVTPTGFFTAANLPADLSSATTASTGATGAAPSATTRCTLSCATTRRWRRPSSCSTTARGCEPTRRKRGPATSIGWRWKRASHASSRRCTRRELGC